jgi:succinate dehydrogenase / fumarate reductase, membrane anchor subunit
MSQSMKTPIGQVRGLGAAKSGTGHFIAQRGSAIALVFLGIWLLVSLVRLSGADYATVTGWLQQPLAAVLLSLFVVAACYHLKLGLQVVVEDYVHGAGRIVALLGVTFFAYALGAACLFAILKVALS